MLLDPSGTESLGAGAENGFIVPATVKRTDLRAHKIGSQSSIITHT
jgi:hypothetical protein